MITALQINNIALIKSANIEFGNGLNVISGETGSGKSIILHSIMLCFGARVDKSLIRMGEKKARVQMLISDISAESIECLVDMGIEASEEIILQREIDIGGKNICRINGNLVSVNSLKVLANTMVDVLGQNENVRLSDRAYQMTLIDSFIGEDAKKMLKSINTIIDEIDSNTQQISSLGGNQQEKDRLIELYSYQLEEIVMADIKDREYESLIERKAEMDDSEKIKENINSAYSQIDGSGYDEGVLSLLKGVIKNIQNIEDYNNDYSILLERLDDVYIEARDILDTLKYWKDRVHYDDREYRSVEGRISQLKELFRKYGNGYDAVMEKAEYLNMTMTQIKSSDETRALLVARNEQLLSEYDDISDRLTILRQQAGERLCDMITTHIHSLGMPKAVTECNVSRINTRYSRKGNDSIDILFSANAGFAPQSLSKIASGGEISRFMLAYKSAINDIDNINTLLFDEVDTGMSGNVGENVAQKLEILATTNQIISITHLATIASKADTIISVSKHTEDGQTYSEAHINDEEGIINEISRMFGAENIAESLALARELRAKKKALL